MNLGNPCEMTILEFAEHIRAADREPSAIVFGRCRRTTPSSAVRTSAKARAVLGWEPRVTLEEGLRLTVEYFRGPDARGGLHATCQ